MTRDDSVWVFGYGSLVSPASVARTIGRDVVVGQGFEPATLDGFGRRWNYGSLRQRADWQAEHGPVRGGVVVSLGLVAAPGEWANGVVVAVNSAELAELDRRESDYDQVDVTDLMRTAHRAPVVTFVPRVSAIERYERHRTAMTAAIRAGYVELVEGAFEMLGGTELADYRTTTPDPDVPVVGFDALWLED